MAKTGRGATVQWWSVYIWRREGQEGDRDIESGGEKKRAMVSGKRRSAGRSRRWWVGIRVESCGNA